MAAGKKTETPLMKQYYGVKSKYPGAIVLFRVGDFYETFDEDAKIASKVLGIVLTKRANGAASHIHLAGFPHHSLETYLPKLVRAGYRVAICDQLEDPKKTKKIVKRGVTELVTPGVSYNDNILESKSSNFLCSICIKDSTIGIAFLDISTGEFMATECSAEYALKLINAFQASEILGSKKEKAKIEEFIHGYDAPIQWLEDWVYTEDFGFEKLTQQLKTTTLKGFGLADMPLAITSGGACLQYLEQTHHTQIEHINKISRIDQSEFMWLDQFTIRNLELLNPLFSEGKSLVDVIDRTQTPMGSRLLKQWIILPLKNVNAINRRLDIVDFFIKNEPLLNQCSRDLSEMADLQRLISKVALNRIGPRECLQLGNTLKLGRNIKKNLDQVKNLPFSTLLSALNPCTELIDLIESHISEEAPLLATKGGIFKSGVSKKLDELRDLTQNGKTKLLEMQQKEQERTGIAKLKIGFNNVFGYYLEVTHANKDKVPEEWVRKQTLTNAERYITEELKEYEEKILNAQEQMNQVESSLWLDFLLKLQDFVEPVQVNASIIAQLDCLMSFASISIQNNYAKPEINDSRNLKLTDCRHPVIEALLPPDQHYIPNTIGANDENNRLLIVTGPNMSGKSALLRQTALSILMAQMGCFVPCKSASIGVFDKVYSRVGASDNISQGESTFMVEMLETASILNNVGENSLIILDEIGRGTSTYDGVSLAWSIVEYLQSHPNKPKTLFATHYHELNELEDKMEGIANYHISVKETGGKIIFLRKLVKGGSENSFGIHVAQMAGIPNKVLLRASEILNSLEADRSQVTKRQTLKNTEAVEVYQLNMFQTEDPKVKKVKDSLSKIDVNAISPIDALLKVQELKNMLN